MAGGIRCRMKRALTTMPSQPSFCTPGKPGEELVGDVLAEAGLAEPAAGNRQRFGARDRCARRRRASVSSNVACAGVVDLAEVVVDARHLEPLRIRRHHPPRHEVVERRAPQHRLLAAGVDGDVAADARRVGRRRIAREHEAVRVGDIHRALRDDTRAAVDRRRRFACAAQHDALDAGEPLELLGVDHRRTRVERDGAAGVAGAAAARNDREAELDAAPRRGRAPRPRYRDAARRTGTRRASRWHRSRATRAAGRRT